MTDLQIQWSIYSKQYIAKVSNRTIVTENPHGKEVQNLLNYAATAPIEYSEIVEQIITTFPDGNDRNNSIKISNANLILSFNNSRYNECETSSG